MIAAVHQPQYLPWIGYFDKMDAADVFVLLDGVQYKKNEWQNRNRIGGKSGAQWLTVPVHYKFGQLIREIEIDNKTNWRNKHAQAIKTCYSRAPFYAEHEGAIGAILSREWTKLSELNCLFIRELAGILGIETRLAMAGDVPAKGRKTERLVEICRGLGADVYLSGQGARDYLEPALFERAGIELRFQNFACPAYSQIYTAQGAPFDPNLSVVDLVMNCGPESLPIIRSGRKR